MIIYSLGLILGYFKSSVLFPGIQPFESLLSSGNNHDDLSEKLKEPFELIFRRVIELSTTKHTSSKRVFNSDLFGLNDPFTLTWFLEFVVNIRKYQNNLYRKVDPTDSFYNKIIDCAMETIDHSFKNPQNVLRWFSSKVKKPKGSHKISLDHAFPLLRVLHLYTIITKVHTNDNKYSEAIDKKIRPFFHERIHQHLSFSNIDDSDFDPAELVFFLEGYLILSAPDRSIDKNLIDRVFNVIKESQKKSTYWRPLKPFASTRSGLIVLPLSIEIVNSLLRICKHLESEQDQFSYFSKYVEVFRRYASWLYVRKVKGEAYSYDKQINKFIGWHSEHVLDTNKIHTWETSQVIIFLLQYKKMLKEHIARLTLYNSNLSVKDLERNENVDDTPEKYWRQKCEKYEPMLSAKDNEYKIYKDIGSKFISTRESKKAMPGKKSYKDLSFSMLLYGPPGTGKTSIAEEISKSLKWKLITITPSDFISKGEAEVETKAKTIFRTLNEQENCVIIFDEIDRLILDRDSKAYQKQSDIFQFMTPSMLVKLRDLRKENKAIFIIATNYEERIDSAIKRSGRIDEQYIVLPPDIGQRKEIIKNRIKKRDVNKILSDDDISHILEEIDFLLKKTVLWTHGELVRHVDTVMDNFQDSTEKDKNIVITILNNEELLKKEPTIRLSSYKSRFKATSDLEDFNLIQEPFEEFFLLVYMKHKENPDFLKNENEIVKEILNHTLKESSKDLDKNDKIQIIDNFLENKIKSKQIRDYLKNTYLKFLGNK